MVALAVRHRRASSSAVRARDAHPARFIDGECTRGELFPETVVASSAHAASSEICLRNWPHLTRPLHRTTRATYRIQAVVQFLVRVSPVSGETLGVRPPLGDENHSASSRIVRPGSIARHDLSSEVSSGGKHSMLPA